MQETYLGAVQNAPFGRSPYHAEVMVTGVADRMSKHRYQLGIGGAGATTRGAARSAGSRGSPPGSEPRHEVPGEDLWKTRKKFFFARDTAALLLDCELAYRIEVALIASHSSRGLEVPGFGAWRNIRGYA